MILLASPACVVKNRAWDPPRCARRQAEPGARSLRTDGGGRDAMSNENTTLAGLESRFEQDGISFLLVQFVDIHGAAKVKLVPAKTLRAVVEEGAGFAGGAVWGMGQGPHSHDMMARVDPSTYTPMPHE